MNDKTYLSLDEVAQKIGIGYSRLWYYLISGRLPEPERVGRARVFRQEDVAVIREFFRNLDGGTAEALDAAMNP